MMSPVARLCEFDGCYGGGRGGLCGRRDHDRADRAEAEKADGERGKGMVRRALHIDLLEVAYCDSIREV